MAISSAAVPFDTAIEYFLLILFENKFSKILTSGPSDDIQPFFKTLFTKIISLLEINGLLTGIKFFLVNFD